MATETRGFVSRHRGARISPKKARPVIDEIRGLPVDEAIVFMQLSKNRGAYFIRQVLETAKANAMEAGELTSQEARNLRVSRATVDEGPTMKRFQPKDRGRAHPILKRTSHITIELA